MAKSLMRLTSSMMSSLEQQYGNYNGREEASEAGECGSELWRTNSGQPPERCGDLLLVRMEKQHVPNGSVSEGGAEDGDVVLPGPIVD